MRIWDNAVTSLVCQQLRLLSEVKTIIIPDDLNTFNELTVRKELEAKKVRRPCSCVFFVCFFV